MPRITPILVGLTCLTISSAATSATTVIGVLVDRVDPVVYEPHGKRMKKLKACGYEVIQVNASSLKEFSAEMQSKASQSKPNTLYWVEAHGEVADTDSDDVTALGTFHFAARKKVDSEPVRLFSDADFVSRATDLQPGSQMWVDACYAGACRSCKSLGGLGAACELNVKSYADNPSSEELIDIMCSGNTDCKRWNQVDIDGDGTIQPRELQKYFSNLYGAKEKLISTSYLKVNGPDQKAKKLIAHCDQVQGKLVETEIPMKLLPLVKSQQVERRKKLSTGKETIVTRFSDFASPKYWLETLGIEGVDPEKLTIAELRSALKTGLKSKGGRVKVAGNNDEYWEFETYVTGIEVSEEQAGPFVEVKCLYESTFKSYGEHSERKTVSPVAGTLTLRSDKCRKNLEGRKPPRRTH